MQSGRSKMDRWVLEYELETAREPEALMGWVSSGDTLNQVRLKFDSLDKAKAFADDKGWTYAVIRDQERRVKPRNYMDNYKYVPFENAAEAEKVKEKKSAAKPKAKAKTAKS